MFGEENRNFTVGWVLNEENDTNVSPVSLCFKYHNMLELSGLPYYGSRTMYGGGGYVADLGTSQRKAARLIDDLIQYEWVDLYTRAVFVEYTVYNPNINLFAFVNFLMEFPAIGGVMPFPRVTSFHVYSGVGSMGTVLVFAELLYAVVIIYFMVHEFMKFRKQRKEYFRDPWSYLEVAIIVTSIAAITMTITREMLGRLVMRQLKDNKGRACFCQRHSINKHRDGTFSINFHTITVVIDQHLR